MKETMQFYDGTSIKICFEGLSEADENPKLSDDELAYFFSEARREAGILPYIGIQDMELHIEKPDAHGYCKVKAHATFDTQKFERIRRITGYLVGDVARFNDAKRAEERARVKHNIPQEVVNSYTSRGRTR